jgi:hypothetical protein
MGQRSANRVGLTVRFRAMSIRSSPFGRSGELEHRRQPLSALGQRSSNWGQLRCNATALLLQLLTLVFCCDHSLDFLPTSPRIRTSSWRPRWTSRSCRPRTIRSMARSTRRPRRRSREWRATFSSHSTRPDSRSRQQFASVTCNHTGTAGRSETGIPCTKHLS